MRSSVIVASSVNASFNTVSRNIHIEERELSVRPAKEPLRVRKPRGRKGFVQQTRPRLVDRENFVEQVPFPRSISPRGSTSENASVSTDSGDGASLRCSTNTANDVAGAAPQDGVFLQCFAFLRRVGVKLVMPPYTIDEGLNMVTRKNGYINLNSTVTELPLM